MTADLIAVVFLYAFWLLVFSLFHPAAFSFSCFLPFYFFHHFTFKYTMSDIDDIIAGGGIVFGKARNDDGRQDGKVKTKAKKKAYITGAHGSGSARQKAKYRQKRANRHKK